MSDRLKLPPIRDARFYQRRKHDTWREVAPPDPALEGPVADSHAHLHMLSDPAWELSRCESNGVDLVCMITDPSEDGARPFDELAAWTAHTDVAVPVAVGVHPHNARLYDDVLEDALLARLDDPRVAALGEVGLDYHYDLSPRDAQRRVFMRQVEIALERDLPIALHIRDAHEEAFEILRAAGALGPRALLHCCTLAPDELSVWVDAGCYIAYGGAITFKNADAAREGVAIVPEDRLLLETDSPYMTPEPMRGAACTPAHVVFTAARLAALRGHAPGPDRRAFLERVHANTCDFLRLSGE